MSHLTRFAVAGFAAALLLAVSPAIAHADTMAPPSASGSAAPVSLDANATPPSGAVANCLDSGSVWLVAITDQGQTLANACVGTPASGTDALTAAGVGIGRDSKGMMCALGGYPNPCPAVFDGRFWQYYTGSVDTKKWDFYQVGSDDSKPAAGTIEGWCYGETCTPPDIALLLAGNGQTPAPAGSSPSSAPVTASAKSNSPWLALGLGLVVVAALVLIAIVRSRRDAPRGKAAA